MSIKPGKTMALPSNAVLIPCRLASQPSLGCDPRGHTYIGYTIHPSGHTVSQILRAGQVLGRGELAILRS